MVGAPIQCRKNDWLIEHVMNDTFTARSNGNQRPIDLVGRRQITSLTNHTDSRVSSFTHFLVRTQPRMAQAHGRWKVNRFALIFRQQKPKNPHEKRMFVGIIVVIVVGLPLCSSVPENNGTVLNSSLHSHNAAHYSEPTFFALGRSSSLANARKR